MKIYISCMVCRTCKGIRLCTSPVFHLHCCDFFFFLEIYDFFERSRKRQFSWTREKSSFVKIYSWNIRKKKKRERKKNIFRWKPEVAVKIVNEKKYLNSFSLIPDLNNDILFGSPSLQILFSPAPNFSSFFRLETRFPITFSLLFFFSYVCNQFLE